MALFVSLPSKNVLLFIQAITELITLGRTQACRRNGTDLINIVLSISKSNFHFYFQNNLSLQCALTDYVGCISYHLPNDPRFNN